MSKEKVDSYKENKYNRKQEKERERLKEKRELFLWKVGGVVFAVAVVVAIAMTGINQ